MEPSDLDLIVRAKKGDDSAFTELMCRHKEKAMRLAYTKVGNYEDAKDIAQDAFVKAYRSLDQFNMKSKFTTWFYRIVMNTANDALRQRKWKKFLSFSQPEQMESFFEKVKDTAMSPEQAVRNQEIGAQITKVIQTLPEKQQWVFTLRFIEGYSLAEIAEITGSPEGTVKANLHFAMKKFKQEMANFVDPGAIS